MAKDEMMNQLKNNKITEAIVQMQYTTDDLLKFTGKSGIYGTVVMDVPASSKTITFAYVPCTDFDNNHYTIVHTGSQVWMEENLMFNIFTSMHLPES